MRLKIIAGNLVAVLLLGLISYFVVKGSIEQGVAQGIFSRIGNDQTLFDRSWRLSGNEFLEQVRDRAGTPPVRDSFGGLDDNSRRRRANQAADGVGSWLGDQARGRGGAPDIVVITDETGKVIARDKDPNRMFQQQLTTELPVLARVLADGTSRIDIWRKADENKILRVAIAPIVNEQGLRLGALVVGYDLSNGMAAREASVLGREIAFVVDDKVYSSSLDNDVVNPLKDYLFGAGQAQTTAALGQNATSQPWAASLAGSDWVGVTAPLPQAEGLDAGYVVLANRTEALDLADSSTIILIMTVLAALVVLGYGLVIGTSFIKPIEEIEEGVLAVINGNTNLRLDIQSPEYGGLAYRINQLINVFTGVSEEDSEGRVSSPPGAPDWSGEMEGGAAPPSAGAPSTAGGAGGGGELIDDANLAAQLSAEPEEQYYTRIYNEYVAAKQSIGENVSNITKERFIERLKGNESSLAQKHGVRMVRFQVQTRGSQVILRPVAIR